jgi:hypothetical protein
MGWTEETFMRKSEEWSSVSAEFAGMSSNQLAEAYGAIYMQVADHEKAVAPTKRKLEVLKAILADKFAEDDLRTVKFENGSSIGVRYTTPFLVEDKVKFVGWLKSNGMESELTVSAARCTSIGKNVFEETQQVPDGLKAGEPVPVVTYRK